MNGDDRNGDDRIIVTQLMAIPGKSGEEGEVANHRLQRGRCVLRPRASGLARP